MDKEGQERLTSLKLGDDPLGGISQDWDNSSHVSLISQCERLDPIAGCVSRQDLAVARDVHNAEPKIFANDIEGTCQERSSQAHQLR